MSLFKDEGWECDESELSGVVEVWVYPCRPTKNNVASYGCSLSEAIYDLANRFRIVLWIFFLDNYFPVMRLILYLQVGACWASPYWLHLCVPVGFGIQPEPLISHISSGNPVVPGITHLR